MKLFGAPSRWSLALQRSKRADFPGASKIYLESCLFPSDSVLFTNNESGVTVYGAGKGNKGERPAGFPWDHQAGGLTRRIDLELTLSILDIKSSQVKYVLFGDEGTEGQGRGSGALREGFPPVIDWSRGDTLYRVFVPSMDRAVFSFRSGMIVAAWQD